jgi:hypothetical protein
MTNRHAITINYTNKAQTRHHATDTNIHERAQGKTLIPITDLSGGAALARPEAHPTGLHKEATDAVLKASVGHSKTNAEFPEDARDKLLLSEKAVPTRYGQVPDVGEQAHHGRAQTPRGLQAEGCEAVCAPLFLPVLRPLLGVPLGGSSPIGRFLCPRQGK